MPSMASVCACVCPVGSDIIERLSLEPSFLIYWYVFTTSRSSIKVIRRQTPATVCIYIKLRLIDLCAPGCDLDLDPMTLTPDLDLDIQKMYPHAENEVSNSKLSKVRART